MKKTILILLAVLVVLLVGCDSSRSNYKDAISAYEDGDYKTATSLFYDLGDYEDSEAYLLSATQEYAAEKISDMENTIKSQDEIDSLFSLCDDLTQAEFAQIKNASEFESMLAEYVGSLGQNGKWEDGLALIQQAKFLSDDGIESCLVSCGRWGCIDSAEDYIRSYLKSPRSYYRYSGFVSTPNESDGHYTVTVTLNYGATNSFGAEVTSEDTVIVLMYIDLEDTSVRFSCLG